MSEQEVIETVTQEANLIESEVAEIDEKMTTYENKPLKCSDCQIKIDYKEAKSSMLLGIVCNECFSTREEDYCMYCNKVFMLEEQHKASEENYCSELHRYLYEHEIYDYEPEPNYYDCDYDYSENVENQEEEEEKKYSCIYCGEPSDSLVCNTLECEIKDYKEEMRYRRDSY